MKIAVKSVAIFSIFLMMLGHTTVASASDVPSKIITMGPNVTEMVVALGAGESIIGTSLNNHSRGPLAEYETIYQGIPELAYGSASRESVLTSGADFVATIDWEIGPAGFSVEELESYGIEVMVEKAKSVDALYDEIETLGSILGKEMEAKALVNNIKAEISSVNPSKEAGKSILVYDSGDQGVFTAGGSNYASHLIQLAGASNIFNDITDKEWFTVSAEEVLLRNPDYLLILDYDQPSLETKIAMLKEDPVLSQLEAVKEERFIILPLEAVLPGIRTGKTVIEIAKGIEN